MRVLIAEDQALLREGLVALFADRGHEVVGSVADASGLLGLVQQVGPDLVVLDVRMPPTFTDEGMRAAAELKHARPEVGVLVLSQHIETAHAVTLLPLGGFGYLLKDRVLDVAQFLDAAQRVAGGGSALDPTVVGALLADPGQDDPLAALSGQERAVLALMAEGLTNLAIARQMFLSERTVEGHVRHVLIKLGIAESEVGHRRVLAVLAHLRRPGP